MNKNKNYAHAYIDKNDELQLWQREINDDLTKEVKKWILDELEFHQEIFLREGIDLTENQLFLSKKNELNEIKDGQDLVDLKKNKMKV